MRGGVVEKLIAAPSATSASASEARELEVRRVEALSRSLAKSGWASVTSTVMAGMDASGEPTRRCATLRRGELGKRLGRRSSRTSESSRSTEACLKRLDSWKRKTMPRSGEITTCVPGERRARAC